MIGLVALAGGAAPIERAGVVVAPTAHLGDQGLVAGVERRQPAAPPQDLGVPGVAGPALGEDRPDRVQLAVLSQQVGAAQPSGLDVPDPHVQKPYRLRTLRPWARTPSIGCGIGELSRRVELSPEVLRAWERRYGVLRPARTDGGLRLYSAADEQRARSMTELLAQGVSAAEAARLVLAGEPAATVDAGLEPLEQDRKRLAAAFEAFDAEAAHDVLDGLFASFTVVEAVLSRVVIPYLRELGDLWERGEATVAHEHFASNLFGRAAGWPPWRVDGVAGMVHWPCSPARRANGTTSRCSSSAWRFASAAGGSPTSEPIRRARASSMPRPTSIPRSSWSAPCCERASGRPRASSPPWRARAPRGDRRTRRDHGPRRVAGLPPVRHRSGFGG